MIWLIGLAIVGFLFYRHGKKTNHKWLMMNNIILAKMTYEMSDAPSRAKIDQAASRIFQSRPRGVQSVDRMIEPDKWRLYSYAMAESQVHPLHRNDLMWTPGFNATVDSEHAYKVHRFEERLARNEYSESHLNLMKA